MRTSIGFRTRLLCAAAGLAFAGLANGAAAQDAPATTELEEVVVTAQLRAQDPIEVPFALTAYTGDFLEKLGVQEFDQLSAFVPWFPGAEPVAQKPRLRDARHHLRFGRFDC